MPHRNQYYTLYDNYRSESLVDT